MFKSHTAIIIVCAFLPVSAAIFCYIGEQKTAELIPSFDYCVSILNMDTLQIRYAAVEGYGESVMFEDDKDISTTHCFQTVDEGLMEIRCYCRTNKCNNMLNVREFSNKVPFDL